MLSFENVAFGYDKAATILEGLCFEVGSGETVALVGANGVGKTTITRLATALQHPVAGVVTVDGRSTDGLSPEDLSGCVAYLFQHVDQQLFASTVVDEVGFGPSNSGCSSTEVRERTESALQRVGLQAESKTHPFDLSPADRKLVGLASALAQKPRLLILDEPTQGMDHNHVGLVSEIVREEATDGCAVIAVTHDRGFVAEALDRVVRIGGGSVLDDLLAKDVVTDASMNKKLGLDMPEIPSLSVALELPDSPVRFVDVVEAVRTVAATRTRR
jgi:energy-coupling factor transporter ATP-binding protein EcfA2